MIDITQRRARGRRPAVGIRAPLPEPEEVAELLGHLLRREVSVDRGGNPKRPRVIAHWLGPGRVVACVADLELTAYAAAALATIPPGGAWDSIADGALEPHLGEHAWRLFAAMGGALNHPGYSTVRLAGVAGPGEFLSAEAQLAFRATRDRLGLAVRIDGYGGGALGFVTAWGAT